MEARFFDIWEDQLGLTEGQKIQRMDCASEIEKPMTLRSEVWKILKLSLRKSANSTGFPPWWLWRLTKLHDINRCYEVLRWFGVVVPTGTQHLIIHNILQKATAVAVQQWQLFTWHSDILQCIAWPVCSCSMSLRDNVEAIAVEGDASDQRISFLENDLVVQKLFEDAIEVLRLVGADESGIHYYYLDCRVSGHSA